MSPARAFTTRTLALLAAGTLLSACVPAGPPGPTIGALDTLSTKEQSGRLVFNLHCQSCHPGGWAGLGPSLNDKPLPGFLIRLQVRNGFGAMPAFGPDRLGDEALDDLVAYVLRLQREVREGQD